MPDRDAVRLVNWIPDDIGVRIRKGFREWAINIPGGLEVKSIFSWIGPSSTFPAGTYLTVPTTLPGRMFAATDSAIYDVTSSTDAPASSQALSGAPDAGRIESAMLTNSAGSFLLTTSEADGYRYFDGTTWTTPTFGGGAGQVANINPNTFVQVLVWKRRAWFVERNSSSAWYLPTDSITGAASEIDFGPLFKNGGHLSYLAKWTIDAGEGIDDFLVAVSSNGDVCVYKGTDPSSPSTFSLVGTWYIGQVPVGRRAHCQYGGDLILLSADGVNPISFVTRGGSSVLVATGTEYSSKIRAQLGEVLRRTFTSQGWQLLLHPSERVLIVNAPDSSESLKLQFVMSTSVNEWTTFNDIPIKCMGMNAGYAFCGTGDGRVMLILNGWQDNIPYNQQRGDAIRGILQPSFSYFDTPAVQKHFTMVRANFLAQEPPNIKIDVATNFSVAAPTGTPSFFAAQDALWDVATWDNAIWGGGLDVYSDWSGVGAIGFAAAAGIISVSTSELVLTSIDYMFHVGGPL